MKITFKVTITSTSTIEVEAPFYARISGSDYEYLYRLDETHITGIKSEGVSIEIFKYPHGGNITESILSNSCTKEDWDNQVTLCNIILK